MKFGLTEDADSFDVILKQQHKLFVILCKTPLDRACYENKKRNPEKETQKANKKRK